MLYSEHPRDIWDNLKMLMSDVCDNEMCWLRQKIVETVISVNSDVKKRMIEKISYVLNGSFHNKIVCFLGNNTS